MSEEPLQLSAFLEATASAGGVSVGNDRVGTSMEMSDATWAALLAFSGGFWASDLDCCAEEFQWLRHNFVVVTAEEERALEEGFLEPAEHPILRPGSLSDLDDRLGSTPLVVLGAPIDVSAVGRTGAQAGPGLIREAFPFSGVADARPGARLVDVDLRRDYRATDLDAVDSGDLTWRPGEGTAPFGKRLGWIAQRVFSAGGTLLTLGGDHSITHFLLKSALDEHGRVGLVHFDAHDDLADFHGRVHHANPFTFVLDDPRVAVVRQIGLRTFFTRPASAGRTDPRFGCWTASEVGAFGAAELLAALLAELPNDLPYYLSFDVDCLSPSLAPETGTPEVGGLAYYPTLELLDGLFRSRQIVGADFVEVSAGPGRFNGAAHVAARYAASYVLSCAPFTDMDRHY